MASSEPDICYVGEKVIKPPLPPPEFFSMFPAPSNATHYPTWEVALKITSYVIVMLIGGVGNILVILVVAMIRRMRSTTNLYVANLAASDVMVSLLCMWVHLGANISPEWPFTASMCKVNNFFQAMSVTASVLFLMIIAGDRFFAIVYPLRAKRSNPYVAGSVIAGAWIISALVAIPHLITWSLLEVQWKDRLERACVESWPSYYYETSDGECLSHKPSRTIYLTVHICILYFLPIVVMTCAYVIIGCTLWKRKVPGEANSKTSAIQMKSRKKVVRMLIVVMSVFFVCWTPQQAIVLYDCYRAEDEPLPDWFKHGMKYAVTFIAYSNSAINPVLYGALNDNFRQGFREAFKCALCLRSNGVGPGFVRTTQVITVRPKSTNDEDTKETVVNKY